MVGRRGEVGEFFSLKKVQGLLGFWLEGREC